MSGRLSPPTSRPRRARVGRIVAHGARTSNSKAAGPVARVLRDLMMPLILKRVAEVNPSRGCTTTTSTGMRKWRNESAGH